MLSARIRELTSTLRFRLVLWITIVVFLTIAIKNMAVREVEHYLLTANYDQFLKESLDDVRALMARPGTESPESLPAVLAETVRNNESRSWFLQIYDSAGRLIYSSNNAPKLPAPILQTESLGPYDNARHRVFERRVRMESGERLLRCGFLHTELQDDIAIVNQNLLIASLSILLLGPIVAYLIAQRATKPIAQIIDAAQNMQPHNLSERLPVRGAGDELDKLSLTINGLLDRLASFINQNRDFVANAAHELRSPLAAIRSSVEVGLNHSRTPEEYAAILSDVMEENLRLAGLVNRLLILAEGDAGRLSGMDQTTRLDKIVRESAEMFDAVAEAAGVHISVAETTPVLVPGDETYLRQIVRNLLDNAIKYNKNPGKVTIWLRADFAAKHAVLIIKDTGIGIDRAMLPRIFERFYRADKSRARSAQRAGSGLGLSICETLIRGLKGTVLVESELGVGSTFTIRLPLIDDPVALNRSGPLPALPAGS